MDRGRSREMGGTGLGLSMIYGFVRQSGGQVRIYSELGHGTTVCLYLPRDHGATAGCKHPYEAAQTDLAGAGETVLVVDDEPMEFWHSASKQSLKADVPCQVVRHRPLR